MVKNAKNGLGRSLVKDRFGSSRGKRTVDNGSMLHTTAVQDGYDWGRLNLQSVTEESSFQEFLSTAELADTEFQAEKLNLKFININNELASSVKVRAEAREKHIASKHLLRVPRRPSWTKDMSPEQVRDNERQSFLEWRRNLSLLQENQNIILTPYEKNLEFWRQLWRVLEKSDILIQVVDARNPLLFRCEDLEVYAKEIGVQCCILLLNKSDLLSEKQRSMWAEYFDKQNVKVVFFSATYAAEKNKDENICESIIEESDKDSESEENSESDMKEPYKEFKENIDNLEASVSKTSKKLSDIISKVQNINIDETTNALPNSLSSKNDKAVECKETNLPGCSTIPDVWEEKNSPEILDKENFIELLRRIDVKTDSRRVIGLVGYPNVGKSSTINALMSSKKVSVSATPGKTKHFQTLLLEEDLMLCDCPGLVLPSFVCTKAEMVVHGILPIDHMHEYMEAIGLIAESLGTRFQAEARLGILLPPAPSDNPDLLSPRDMLNAYAYSRGMMTGNGQPDCARAARVILRAATRGLLPLVVHPPGSDINEYSSNLHPPLKDDRVNQRRQMIPKEMKALRTEESSEDFDRRFFAGCSNVAHMKGTRGKFYGLVKIPDGSENIDTELISKPWKLINKHANKNKRQKIRRMPHHQQY